MPKKTIYTFLICSSDHAYSTQKPTLDYDRLTADPESATPIYWSPTYYEGTIPRRGVEGLSLPDALLLMDSE